MAKRDNQVVQQIIYKSVLNLLEESAAQKTVVINMDRTEVV